MTTPNSKGDLQQKMATHMSHTNNAGFEAIKTRKKN